MPKLKIALLSGGISGEREVSLKTGEQIYNALNKDKYEILKYDPKIDLKEFINDAIDKKFDLVFPALHGPFGEDGRLQGMLDMIKMPYVFSGCLASALAMNKHKSKIIAQDAGLDIIPSITLSQGHYEEQSDEVIYAIVNNQRLPRSFQSLAMTEVELSLPIVIKPIELGSSVGMSIAKNEKELKQGIELAFKHDNKIMLEKFIKGRELTVGVMGKPLPNPPLGKGREYSALPVIEIIPKVSDWFDYKAKYEVGGSDEICPAEIPDQIKDKVQSLAIKIFKAIDCKDVARADFIWDSNKIYFLEINTIPGMTQTSLVPQAAKVAGMEFSQFLDKLIQNALN